MKLLVELEPTRNISKLDSYIARISRLYCIWRVVVPDAPLGKPKASSLMTAVYLEHAGVPTLVNFRLRDVNRIACEQLIWGAYLNNIKYILFLRGDKPQNARDVDEVDSETAISYVKSDKRLASAIRAGIYLSFRFPPDRVLERARRSNADFFVVNRVNPNKTSQMHVVDRLREYGEVYAYAIVAPKTEAKLLSDRLEGQPVFELEGLGSVLRDFENFGVNGVILSAPGHMHDLLNAIAELCRDY